MERLAASAGSHKISPKANITLRATGTQRLDSKSRRIRFTMSRGSTAALLASRGHKLDTPIQYRLEIAGDCRHFRKIRQILPKFRRRGGSKKQAARQGPSLHPAVTLPRRVLSLVITGHVMEGCVKLAQTYGVSAQAGSDAGDTHSQHEIVLHERWRTDAWAC
jgi:hypothetical protein